MTTCWASRLLILERRRTAVWSILGRTYQVVSEESWIPPSELATHPLRARQPPLNVLSEMLCPGSYMAHHLHYCSTTRIMRYSPCATPQGISRKAAAEVVFDKARSSCNAPNL